MDNKEETFFEILRRGKFICDHPDASFHVEKKDDGDRILKCRECATRSISLKFFLCQMSSAAQFSLKNAEAYVAWSGDQDVPCCIETIFLRNRALTAELKTTYATVAKGCAILRVLHAPFAAKEGTPCFETTAADFRFLRDAVGGALQELIERASDDLVGTAVGSIAKNVLVVLKSTFAAESKHYFDVLVPYVKLCERQNTGPLAGMRFDWSRENLPLHRALEDRTMESEFLHDTHSKYCAAFDAVHVAALCFLCRDDLGLVYDLALDFAGKFGRGYYDGAFSSGYRVHDDLEREICKVLSDNLYSDKAARFLDAFRTGGEKLAESFSDRFFKNFWEVKSEILHLMQVSQKEPRFERLFPRVLFRDYADFYAFRAALAHYAAAIDASFQKMDNFFFEGAAAPPGVVAKCKEIFRFVKRSLSKVKAYQACFAEGRIQKSEMDKPSHSRLLDPYELDEACVVKFSKRSDGSRSCHSYSLKRIRDYTWSRKTLQVLFDCDPSFRKKLVDATGWLLTDRLSLYEEPDFYSTSKDDLYVKDTNSGENCFFSDEKNIPFDGFAKNTNCDQQDKAASDGAAERSIPEGQEE